MALERLQALALVWVPQHDLVVNPAAREKLAVKTPCDCTDPTAAIFPNVRNTYVVVVYASPPLNLRLSPGERGEGVGKTVTLTGLPTQRTMLTCKYPLP